MTKYRDVHVTAAAGKARDEDMSDSSGISVSFSTEKTERFLSSRKHRLRQIVESHKDIEFRNGKHSSYQQGQSRQSFTPFLPTIENKSRLADKGEFEKLNLFVSIRPLSIFEQLYLILSFYKTVAIADVR